MIQLETKKLTYMLSGLVLLGLGLFVFGAFGERTSHALTRPFVKLWRKASDSKDVAVEWVDAETLAKDKKILELERKVLDLQLQVGDARDLRAENSQLRKMFKLEQHPGWTVLPAEVIIRDPVLWDYAFTIDKGMAEGVTVGAVVMQAGNVAGRVAKVERHQSMVETVLSPNCRFSVTIGSTGDAGVLHGVKGTDRTSPFRCQTDFLPLDIEAMGGMKVQTSGLGILMPGGLPIGEVVEVEGKVKEDIEHARAMLRVKPYAELQDVRFVTVLLKKNQ